MRARRGSALGLTLVEILVALGLTSLVAVVLLAMTQVQSSTQQRDQRAQRALDNFTNRGSVPDCNGCGYIGRTGSDAASTAGANQALGNEGLAALGVDMRGGQITLAEQTAYPFFFAPGSAEGVIVKINTATGQVMAKYRTAPQRFSGNPSRTTVDLQGNVWVSNRNIPSGYTVPTITKIGLSEAGACQDRNGNGVIETSQSASDLKDWTGDWNSGILGAKDECILLHVGLQHEGATTPRDARMLAIDSENNLYAGGLTSPAVYHIRGTDGAILKAANSKQGHYGGVLDRDGFIWSMHVGSGRVEKIWPDLSRSELYRIGHPGYALSIDINGRIWTSSWTPKFSVLDPDGTNLQVFNQHTDGASDSSPNVGCCAQGIVTNHRGEVFLAGSLSSNHVGHYRFDPASRTLSFVRNYIVDPSPVGVVVDAAGKVWSAGYSRTATRIDPETGEMATFRTGVQSYTYSDATGYVVRTATSPQGTWTVTQNCGNNCTGWRSVAWGYHEPPRTEIQVRARSADTLADLQTATWVRLENGATVPRTGAGSLPGSLLQVEVKLISRAQGVTPVIYDVTITPWDR